AIAGDQIMAVGLNLADDGEEIDATGLHVFPGGIDSHVHFNEPGRTEWEDIAHGSAALAAGGYTSFIDMPLNNLPVTTDVEAFDLKAQAMTRSSKLDFGLWGGLVPGNLDQLEPLVRRGVMGFKAFMCPSGIDEFPASDRGTLREGMKRIAALGSILLVHAEDPARLLEPRGTSALDFIRSRPPEAERSAISEAIELADATGCPLHVVHVSTARGMDLIREAQQKGLDVSGETCPHYLLYMEEDLERLGGAGKCAPPFRTARDREALWTAPMVVSDHSPSTIELKQGSDFGKIWGGISGCQSTRQLLLAQDRLELGDVAAVTASNIARRFGLQGKGAIATAYDADLWLVELAPESVVRKEDLFYRNPFSAHEGQRIRGRTVRTLVRGETVFMDGKPATARIGRLLRPSRGAGSPR
ncbi:MAG: allantoinase, partial [Chloroflexota bacterium]|nr:allantoinase [Chloroflexota bacterium]